MKKNNLLWAVVILNIANMCSAMEYLKILNEKIPLPPAQDICACLRAKDFDNFVNSTQIDETLGSKQESPIALLDILHVQIRDYYEKANKPLPSKYSEAHDVIENESKQIIQCLLSKPPQVLQATYLLLACRKHTREQRGDDILE